MNILSTVLLVAAWTSWGKNPDQAARIKKDVEQAIPLGMEGVRATAVLDSLQIEHSAYDSATRQIIAIVRNVSRTSTTTTALQIALHFDSAGELTSHDFRPVRTGP